MISNPQPDDIVEVDYGLKVGRYVGIVIGVDGDRVTVLIGLKKDTVSRSQLRFRGEAPR
jgi:hypothetical protein